MKPALSGRRQRSTRIEREVAVILRQRGWKLLAHNLSISNIQVDLLMRTPCGLLTVVEVKAQGPSGLARLSVSQRRRLSAVCSLLAQREPVELHVAFLQGKTLQLVPVDALTER